MNQASIVGSTRFSFLLKVPGRLAEFVNTLFKNTEIQFRRLLISCLRFVMRTRRDLPNNYDFKFSKFLFVRQDRIGDVLVSTPIFYALKKKYPDATVDVLLSPKNHFALANNPLIRKRWIYDKGFLSSVRLMSNIRREHYDFVVDLMDNPSATSTVICLISGAGWTVGLDKDNAYVYDVLVPLISRRDSHIVDRIARLLVPFGIDPSAEDLRVRYSVADRAQHFARKVFEEFNLESASTIGVNISAGHDVRFWGVDNFRALIQLVTRRHRSWRVLLLAKPAHEFHAKQIVDGLDHVFLSPMTHSFDEFAGLIRGVSLLVTPDTAAVHLAAAFGIPSVVLYVQSDKNLRIWEPYRTRSEVLVADVDDLRVISPEKVCQAAERLIREHQPRRRHASRRAAVRP